MNMEKMLNSRSKLQEYVLKNARQGDIQNVIDTIDEFGKTQQWLMNIGDKKGKILDQAVQARKPTTILELGTFLGYSALRIASQLQTDTVFISIEADALSAAIARSVIAHAGLTDRVKVINGDTSDVIPRLRTEFNIDSFDLVFIDHYKDFYLRDLKMLEDNGLVKSESVIVADNVITPGAPEYLKYVRTNPKYTNTFYESTLEYHDEIPDGIEISVRS